MVSTQTLQNGFRVVIDPMPSIETASVGVWVDVGARDETQNFTGMSHVLEHMAFKGTATRSALEISQEIENVGGYLNAHTAREHTAYYARVLKDNVELAIDILADILLHTKFDPLEWQREQNVILQEIAQTHDTPDDLIFDVFQEACFPDQSVGRPILGSKDNVLKFTTQDIQDFKNSLYSPEKMVLVASGKVDEDKIMALAETYFGQLTTIVPPYTRQPPTYSPETRAIHKESEQVHFISGYESISSLSPDRYACSTLSAILGGGMSSRLFYEIREKRGLVYTINAFRLSHSDAGVFGIYGCTTPDHMDELQPVLIEETEKIQNHVKASELERAKNQIKAAMMMAFERPSARCETLANQMLLYGQPLNPKEIIKKVDAVTVEEVQALAQNIFSSPPSFVTVGP